MYPVTIFEPKIREIAGEPLEGSGFETEDPASGFDSPERSAEEDINQ